jgi:tetraacyldisaccharide 4'-kinase
MMIVNQMPQEQPVPSLTQKINAVIKSEKPACFFSLETLLQGFSVIYGTLVQLKTAAFNRKIRAQKALPCAVISIGNITVGGTGKTPMAIYLARLVTSLGYRVVILSRGYKGSAEKTGGIVGNGKALLMSPAQAGDEPIMMASTLKGVPVVVGRNRYEAGNRAIMAFSPDVIILDDGFQHLKLARDINLVLVDHHRPFGNRHLLPRGPLREPVSAIKRADIIIETRCDVPTKPGVELGKTMQRLSLKTPVYQSSHIPDIVHIVSGKRPSLPNLGTSGQACSLSLLQGKRAFVFSGIADNRNFHRTLTGIGCHFSGFREFPDHYNFCESDLAAIANSAIDRKAELILTTQKDAVRIPTGVQWPVDLVVIGITPHLGEQTDSFKNHIKSKLLMGRSGVLPHASA